jgi:hypothetical protein
VITESLNRNQRPALSSNLWHVVHARWLGNESGEPRFERSIVSEHEDRESAIESAKRFGKTHTPEMSNRPATVRDQILVRRPDFRSLKVTRRWKPRAD